MKQIMLTNVPWVGGGGGAVEGKHAYNWLSHNVLKTIASGESHVYKKKAPGLNYHLFILAESQEAENPSDARENHL